MNVGLINSLVCFRCSIFNGTENDNNFSPKKVLVLPFKYVTYSTMTQLIYLSSHLGTKKGKQIVE